MWRVNLSCADMYTPRWSSKHFDILPTKGEFSSLLLAPVGMGCSAGAW